MKISLVCLVAFTCIASASASCHHSSIKCYEAAVNKLINHQIEVELKGQYTYLYLSNVFLRNDMYYPKVAAYFRKKSDEEMQHAERFIEYQNQRGGKFDLSSVQRKTGDDCGSITSLLDGFECAKALEISVTHALTKLLKDVSDVVPLTGSECVAVESHRRSLVLAQPMIITIQTANGVESTVHLNGLDCATDFNITKVEYVELADMINHEFLGHQIEDTKELANIVSTLGGFSGTGSENSKLGNFLYDKHLDL